jgi:uncharacterized PurR-regulated membrane protein YhhQ (DUF165 family)
MSLRQRYGTPVALAIVLALVIKVLILYWLWSTFIAAPHGKHSNAPAARIESTPSATPSSGQSQRP